MTLVSGLSEAISLVNPYFLVLKFQRFRYDKNVLTFKIFVLNSFEMSF